MKVERIDIRKKHLTAVIFSDGSEILLDNEVVLTENINVGANIEDIEKLIYISDFKRAKSRALWYLSRSDHSEKALLDKLLKGGFGQKASEDAVARMKELGLVNDEVYAARLAEYLKSTGISNRELQYKLIMKGIDKEIAKELSSTETDETEKIKYLLEHKFHNKLNDEKNVEKVFAALVRKGFSYSDVKSALKEYSEELRYSED